MPLPKSKLELTWIGKENRPKLRETWKCKEFFQGQDTIDARRGCLMSYVEGTLNQRTSSSEVFAVQWQLV